MALSTDLSRSARGSKQMGMFNTIVADIPCPETGKLSKDTEIKWQDRDARVLDV
ncbi:MAG: hypothetical protein KAU41_02865 [Deltaproteobacteria bacterium]|nr:hypothetical protein [Deltaproteobacteria bacterium]